MRRDNRWLPLSLLSPPTQGFDKVLTAGTTVLMIYPSCAAYGSVTSTGCNSGSGDERWGGRDKGSPATQPLTLTSEVHSSGRWWLRIPGCRSETSLAILQALAVTWFCHSSFLLSSDVVSFLILPLYSVTLTAGTAGNVLCHTKSQCCVCADTVSVQPVPQGWCLLYFCGLKTNKTKTKQDIKKTALLRRALAVN